MKPLPHSRITITRLFAAWPKGAAVAGILSVGAFFVAAQAGSLNPVRLEVEGLLRPAPDRSPEARPAVLASAGHRTYSGGPGAGGPEYVGPAKLAVAASGDLGSVDWSAATDTTTDTAIDAPSDPTDSLMQSPLELSVAATGEDFSRAHRAAGGFGIGGGGSSGESSGTGSPGRASGLQGQAIAGDAAEDQKQALLTQPSLAAAVGQPAPEPTTWAIMILGLGLTGVALRGQRRRWA